MTEIIVNPADDSSSKATAGSRGQNKQFFRDEKREGVIRTSLLIVAF